MTAPQSLNPPNRLKSLDVLRGVAVLFVLFRHTPGVQHGAHPGIEQLLLLVPRRVGWVGVDLFFVLSGFLISGLLFKELTRTGKLDVPRFWLRRGLKIWPAYFVAYGWLVVSKHIGHWSDLPGRLLQSLRENWQNILFIQNYFPMNVRWPHSWSLAVEEHFYLLLPVALLGLLSLRLRGSGRLPIDRLPGCLLLLCGTVLAARTAYVWSGATWGDVYYPTHFRMDSLAFGVLLGYWNHFAPQQLDRAAALWPVALVALILQFLAITIWPLESSKFQQSFGFSCLYLSFGGLVVLAARRPDFASGAPSGIAILIRAVSVIGVYSYTIYLAHSVVFHEFLSHRLFAYLEYATGGRLGRQLAFWILSLAGGVLLSHLVERPVLRWRERRFPSRSPAQPAPVAASASSANSAILCPAEAPTS